MNRSTWLVLAIGLVTAASGAQITRESLGPGGIAADAASLEVAISDDGRFVAFTSDASNLVAGAYQQVYLRDRQTLQTTVVSTSTAGNFADAACGQPSISADGRFVAFATSAGNLGGSVASSGPSVFVRDRLTSTTQMASVSSAGVVGNLASYSPAISGDGRYVAFTSRAQNLIDGTTLSSSERVFVRDLQLGVTALASLTSSGATGGGFFPAISFDGRYVTFASVNALVAGDGNGVYDIYLRDRLSGSTELVSMTPGGVAGGNYSWRSSVSADGRYVAFSSQAPDLVGFATMTGRHIYLRDRLAQATSLVSAGPTGAEIPGSPDDWPAISADGLHVVFSSAAPLIAGDTNNHYDVFVRDLLPGQSRRISVADDGTQANGDSPSQVPTGPIFNLGTTKRTAVSSDGRFVAFSSSATNLVYGDTNGFADIFVVDRSCTVQFSVLGQGLAGTGGAVPLLFGFGGSCAGGATIAIAGGRGGAAGLIAAGVRAASPLTILGGLVYLDVSQPVILVPVALFGSPAVPGSGSLVITGVDLSSLEGQTLYLQAFIVDPAAAAGWSMTNAMSISVL